MYDGMFEGETFYALEHLMLLIRKYAFGGYNALPVKSSVSQESLKVDID